MRGEFADQATWTAGQMRDPCVARERHNVGEGSVALPSPTTTYFLIWYTRERKEGAKRADNIVHKKVIVHTLLYVLHCTFLYVFNVVRGIMQLYLTRSTKF